MFRDVAVVLILIAVVASYANSQETVSDQIAIGEKLRKEFQYQEALEAFLKAYKIDSNNSEVIWRIARAYVDLGDQVNKRKKKALYQTAEKYARKGTKIDPDSSYCHTYLAVVVGQIAMFEGGKTKIKLSKEVKKEAIKAVKLDPKNDLAYHILGRWHREVANLNRFLKIFAKTLYGGLPKASNEESVKYFKKAIEVKPELIIHHFELAKTYQKMEEWRLALKELDEVDRLPATDSGDRDDKRNAKRMRAEIEK